MSKVQEIIDRMARRHYPQSLFFCDVKQLLFHYPEMVFTPEMRGTTDIFHDLEKRVTPHGNKNSLSYRWPDLVPVMKAELEKMVEYRNAIVKILMVIKAARNKKLVLSVLEHMFKVTLSTGGGTSPMVRRIIMMYEREGNVKQNKRKTDECAFESSTSTLSKDPETFYAMQKRHRADSNTSVDDDDDDDDYLIPVDLFSESVCEQPLQHSADNTPHTVKVKNLDYPVTDELIQVCQDLITHFGFAASDDTPIADDLIDDLVCFDDDNELADIMFAF